MVREEDDEFVSEVTPTPVDAKSAPNYRVMQGVVIGLGALIVIGLVVLVYGLVAGWGHHSTAEATAAAPKKPVSMALEPGYRILSSDTQPNRLILHVRSDTSDQIYVIDTTDGHIVAVIHGEAPKQ